MSKSLTSQRQAVIYFNRGKKCCLRMVVSIYSLRKHYVGDVVVLCQGPQPSWFEGILTNAFKCDLRQISETNEKNPLAIKPQLWKYVKDYELVMFLDADTLILKSIDKYFDLIRENGFVTGNFSNWKTRGSQISKRIKEWKTATPDLVGPALRYGTAVNTGINGWVTGTQALSEWERVCALGRRKRCTDRVVDEIACQLVLPRVKHALAGPEWGASVKFYNGNVDDIRIIHYHGKKHVGGYSLCDHWKENYLELVDMGLLDGVEKYYDRSVSKWLKARKQAQRVTLVTSVSNDYFKKFKKNFEEWMKINLFREMPKVIFVDDECFFNSKVADLVNKHNADCKIVRWVRGGVETTKELMLSAFTFGVAEHVKTKYWIKIDCDVTPKSKDIQLPDRTFKHTLTATKWGYTKVKCDPQYLVDHTHWLKRLDEWANALKDFEGTRPLFEGVNIPEPKHKHRRICSFFAIEKTAFTRHLADMCKRSQIKNGRLPIPSHDTLVWYVITRLGNGRSILEHNFREQFRP